MLRPANFKEAVEFVMEVEGGETTDAGGYTKYGISQRAYPHFDISKLTIEDAERIYHSDYWDALNLGDLPHPVALVMMEASVNMGRVPAVRCLQRAINLISGCKRLRVDGDLGPLTKEAVVELPAVLLATMVAIGRLGVHYRLAAYEKYSPYMRGWAGRCVRLCEQLARDWAESNMED